MTVAPDAVRSLLDFVVMVPVYFVPFAYAVLPDSIFAPLSSVASVVSKNSALPELPERGILTLGTFCYVISLITTFWAMITPN